MVGEREERETAASQVEVTRNGCVRLERSAVRGPLRRAREAAYKLWQRCFVPAGLTAIVVTLKFRGCVGKT